MSIAQNLSNVLSRIEISAHKCGRNPSDVRLLAISKTKMLEEIIEAVNMGQLAFGENYAQELRDKAKEITDTSPDTAKKIEWHFIGHMQRNKVKYVAPVATWIHSIDSLELATAVNERVLSPINTLIEVNIAQETSKSGVKPEVLAELLTKLNVLDKISVKGLMCMPPISDEPENSRPYFKRLRELLGEMNTLSAYKQKLTDLSMGMSNDFEVAVEEGATILRVGTAIFGERSHK